VSFGAPGAAPAFGDIVELPWLADAQLRADSTFLRRVDIDGQPTGFAPTSKPGSPPAILTFGQRAPGVIVDDDCHVEDVLVGRGEKVGGRLRLAAVRPASPDEMKLTGHFSLMPLPGEAPFDRKPFRGRPIVDFAATVSIAVRDRSEADAVIAGRIATPSDALREEMRARWAAHATRRGPIVAGDATEKIADLLLAQGFEATETLRNTSRELLTALWLYESRIEDAMTDWVERQASGADFIAAADQVLDVLQQNIDATRSALGGCTRP
jgi:hypothetical protein